MAQRIVELIVGRLITDEGFRTGFLADPAGTLAALSARGFDLTAIETAALIETDAGLWARAADALDARLQKVCLTDTATQDKEHARHV